MCERHNVWGSHVQETEISHWKEQEFYAQK